MNRDGRIVVLGAGLAGATCAWALTRIGFRDVLVLEREQVPGAHATAQNAAMVRSLVDEPCLTSWALQGTRFWNELPEEFAGRGLFRRSGSLLLAGGEEAWERLQARAAEARATGIDCELWSPATCRERQPLLVDTPLRGGVFTRDDGIGDPAGLVDAALQAATHAGATLRLGAEVISILREWDRVSGVELGSGERIEAELVLVAAGAWVDALLRSADLPERALLARRRHLLATSAWPSMDPAAPFVWHVDGGAYFRPEGGGVLFSVCDELVVEPGVPSVDDSVYAEAESKLAELFPFLAELPIAHAWAGLRTYRDGGDFVHGPSTETQGLAFAAGLGGHGVTCAGALALAIAEELAGIGKGPG